MANTKSTISQFKEDLLNELKVDTESFLKASGDLSDYANQVNKFFTQGRQRIVELKTALADATPNVTRLGGSMAEAATIMGEVADASRRNVVATSEEVEKLYAAEKVLGLGADQLTNSFLNVGRGVETIGDTLDESVNYIQSIGGNAKAVMEDVNNNMEQMNRYQFEGGVIGLTKMAAQASLLRFDMSTTFKLAEDVLSPEKAIETAGAFQRLGVAAGTLVDPFALMNASINDPGALQDSLVDVAKQFTYFDEETKTFKINPQGVLTLREMGEQTGVSAKEMSRLGLAAAEADMRLSKINAAGLTIVNEEDKQYLANIAKMEEGTYKVTLEDGTKKELAELTQPEFQKLIDEQKKAPKDMEGIARSQMKLSEVMVADIAAIKAKFVGGVVSAGPIVRGEEDLRSGITNVTGEFSKMGDTASVRKPVEQGLMDLKTLYDDLKKGDDYTDDVAKYLESSGNLLSKVEKDFRNSLENTVKGIGEKANNDSVIKQLTDAVEGRIGETEASLKKTAGNQPISSLLEGSQNQMREVEAASSASAGSQRTQIELLGGIKMDINFNGDTSGLTPAMKEQMVKEITNKFNSMDYKQFMANVTTKQDPTKSDSQFYYGGK
jgi:hypothetical protein